MDLKEVKTEQLITELKKRKEIQSYHCGLYQDYLVTISEKYNHTPIELPTNSEVLVFASPD